MWVSYVTNDCEFGTFKLHLKFIKSPHYYRTTVDIARYY